MATSAPKAPTHALGTGALYGAIAGVLYVALAYVNKQFVHGNGILGVTYTAIIPLVAIYLAGHLTGRKERLNLGTTISSGTRSTLTGTGAGITTGVVYVIVSSLLQYIVNRVAGTSTFGSEVLGFLAGIGGFIIWLIAGIFAGTAGGFFGDNRAHKQLKSGATVAGR